MNRTRWLASPLAGTAAVLAGLCLIAIPLRHLTAARRTLDAPAVAATPGTVHAVLRVRLLAPARRVMVTTAAGALLVDRRDLPAGQSEHDAIVPWDGGALDLTLQADIDSGGAETAVFLTVMPDGYDDQTRYGIGRGRIDELLRYAWPTPAGES